MTPLRVAHRGYRTVARENSLDQIRHAIELGADFVELDVRRRPSDGVLVLDHDRGDRPGAPLLDEALALLASSGTGADLDLKQGGLLEDLLAALERGEMLDHTVCTGGDWGQLRDIKRADPRVRVGITVPRTSVNVPRVVERYGLLLQRRAWARRLPGLITQFDADLVAAHHRIVDAAFVRAAHSVRAQVWCWTVDHPRDLARLAALGVDAVCSDRPESHGFVWQAPGR